MKGISEHLIGALWPELAKVGERYTTPDEQKGADFIVVESDESTISIKTTGGSIVQISRDSFIAALFLLIQEGHMSKERVCLIGANICDPGSLDSATRVQSGGTMVISYILSILAETGIVGIDGERPNVTWINV